MATRAAVASERSAAGSDNSRTKEGARRRPLWISQLWRCYSTAHIGSGCFPAGPAALGLKPAVPNPWLQRSAACGLAWFGVTPLGWTGVNGVDRAPFAIGELTRLTSSSESELPASTNRTAPVFVTLSADELVEPATVPHAVSSAVTTRKTGNFLTSTYNVNARPD